MAFEALAARMTLDSGDYVSSIGRAEAATGSLGATASDLQGTMAAAGAGIAAVAAGGMAAATREAMRMGQNFADLQKVTSKGIAEGLKDDITSLSEQLPIAREELTTLATQAGKFGAESEEAIAGFVSAVGRIQTATDMAASVAGKRFAKIAGAVGMPMGAVDSLGNAVNKLADSFKTDAGEITDTATRASNVLAQQLGLGEDAVVALSATMNEVSSSSRLAAGGLKRAAEAMLSPKKVSDIAAALGITGQKFRSLRQSDPHGLMKRIAKRMAEGGESAATLRTAVGTRAARAFSKLGSQLGTTEKAQKLVNQQFENGTSLNRELSIRTDTLAGKMQLAEDKLRNLAASTGQAYMPAVKAAVGVLGGFLDRLTSVNEATDGMAGAIGLATTLVGGLTVGLGGLIGVLQTSTAATAALSGAATALSTGLTLVLAPLAALGAAFVAYKQNLLGFRDGVAQVVATLQSSFAPALQQARTLVKTVVTTIASVWQQRGGEVIARIQEIGSLIKADLIPVIKSLAPIVQGALARVTQFWNQHGDAIVNGAITAIVAGLDALVAGYRALRQGVQVALPVILDLWNRYVEPIATRAVAVFQSVVSAAQTYLPQARQTAQASTAGISQVWTQYIEPLVASAQRVFSTIQAAVARYMPQIRRIVRKTLLVIDRLWTNVLVPLGQIAQQVFGKIASIVGRYMPQIRAVFMTGVEAMRALWKRWGDDILRIGRMVFNALQSIVSAAVDALTALWNFWGEQFVAVARFTFDLLRGIFESALNTIEVILDVALAALEGRWGDALDYFIDYWKQTWTGIFDFISKWVGRFIGWFDSTFVQPLIGFFEHLYQKIIGGSLIPDLFNGIRSFVEDWVGSFVEWFKTDFIDVVIGHFETLYGDALGWVSDLIADIDSAIRGWTLVSDIAGLLSDVVSKFKNMYNDALGWVEDLISDANREVSNWDLAKKVAQAVEDAKKEVSNLYENVVGGSIIPDMVEDSNKVIKQWDLGRVMSKPIDDAIGTVEQLPAAEPPTAALAPRPRAAGSGGDTINIDVTVEGDGDERTIKQAVQEALDARGRKQERTVRTSAPGTSLTR